MGEARRRGTFEQRREEAINAGRLKAAYRRKLIFRNFDDVINPPKEPKQLVMVLGGTPAHLAVKNIVQQNIKQPGDNRKEHKPVAVGV